MTIVYEASVYSRTIQYKNFKGEEKETELNFVLDPLLLMEVFAGIETPRNKKSGNPALRGKEEDFSDEQQLKMIRSLASKAAGTPSDDGESWHKFEDFDDSIAGKAFLAQLTSSDAWRKEFAEKVILDPFRTFVNYATEDESNSPAEVADLVQMLTQMENVFKVPEKREETLEEKKARLTAELAATDTPSE